MNNSDVRYKPLPPQEAVNYMYDFAYDHLRENTSPECRAIIMPLFGDVTNTLKIKAEEARNDKQK